MRVEYRLLQIVLSAVSGDRVTAALLHWDGTHLRLASSPAALSSVEPIHREGIRVAVDDLVRRASRRASQLEKQPELDVGLQHAFQVREGMGAALFWTPIVSRETADPAAHFLELKREIHLDHEPQRRTLRVTERRVYDRLVALGESLQREAHASTWVRISHAVTYKMTYEVPFSWKNGKWHHAVPLSLDVHDARGIDDEIRRMYGLVDLSLPKADVAVFVAAMPSRQGACEQATRELRMMRLMLKPKRLVELVIPERQGRALDFEVFEKRVRKDLQQH